MGAGRLPNGCSHVETWGLEGCSLGGMVTVQCSHDVGVVCDDGAMGSCHGCHV